MMKRICVLFSSILLFSASLNAEEPDTLILGKALIFGAELTGPVIYAIDNNILSYEGYAALRLNQKYFLVAEAGYADYRYEQYNYSYRSKGTFIRLGTDINLLKPRERIGDNFVGIGFRYGLSVFEQQTPWFKYENYWGEVADAIPGNLIHGHFLQLSGGLKAELFENIFIGWTIRINMMIYQSSDKETRPVFIPGMGGTDSTLEPGISFHLAWQLPLN